MSTQALLMDMISLQGALLIDKEAEREFAEAALDAWLGALEAYSTADESPSVKDVPLSAFMHTVMEETLAFRLAEGENPSAARAWRDAAARLEMILCESAAAISRARSVRSRQLIRSSAAAANQDLNPG